MSAAGAEIELVMFRPVYPPFHKTPLSNTDEAIVSASGPTPIGNAKALHGWSLLEASGTNTCSIVLYDGSGVDGLSFAPITLLAAQSTRDYFGNNGLICTTGKVYLQIVSGELSGVLYWRD